MQDCITRSVRHRGDPYYYSGFFYIIFQTTTACIGSRPEHHTQPAALTCHCASQYAKNTCLNCNFFLPSLGRNILIIFVIHHYNTSSNHFLLAVLSTWPLTRKDLTHTLVPLTRTNAYIHSNTGDSFTHSHHHTRISITHTHTQTSHAHPHSNHTRQAQ